MCYFTDKFGAFTMAPSVVLIVSLMAVATICASVLAGANTPTHDAAVNPPKPDSA